MTTTQLLLTVFIAALATMCTRFLPFLLFPGDRQITPMIEYLGKVLAPAVFGLLVVYCLRDVSLFAGTHGIPEAVGIFVTVALHLWRKNLMLSMAGGTLVYMLLVQLVF